MLKLALLLCPCVALALEPCRVEIVDQENGWPVPLVELRTTHEVCHVSNDPELLGREVWLQVQSHG